MWFLLMFLVMGVVVLYVSVGTMLAKYKPYGVASISALLGGINAWFLETRTNFTAYVLTPAWESLYGVRPWDLYGVGATIMMIGMIMVIVVAFFNAIMTWSKNTPFSLWR